MTASPAVVIGSRLVGPAHPPLVVAELGLSHCGSLGEALGAVALAAELGIEAIKLQCHVPEEHHAALMPAQVVRNIALGSLSLEAELSIRRECSRLGLLFLSTPFSLAALARFNTVRPDAIKIGSGEITSTALLDSAARLASELHIPLILSTGLGTSSELDSAVTSISSNLATPTGSLPLVLLHCVSKYPTPPALCNLPRISKLSTRYPRTVVGYSDHTAGITVPAASPAFGACLIEKHVIALADTSDPTRFPTAQSVPDAAVSVSLPELAQLNRQARDVWKASAPAIHTPDPEVRAWALHHPSDGMRPFVREGSAHG